MEGQKNWCSTSLWGWTMPGGGWRTCRGTCCRTGRSTLEEWPSLSGWIAWEEAWWWRKNSLCSIAGTRTIVLSYVCLWSTDLPMLVSSKDEQNTIPSTICTGSYLLNTPHELQDVCSTECKSNIPLFCWKVLEAPHWYPWWEDDDPPHMVYLGTIQDWDKWVCGNAVCPGYPWQWIW